MWGGQGSCKDCRDTDDDDGNYHKPICYLLRGVTDSYTQYGYNKN
jgi:hypothetical protein